MASIRDLKKNINVLTYELLTEAFTYKHFHPEVNEKKFDEVILDLVKLRNELIARINSKEKFDKPAQVKAHFNKIQNEMINLVKVVDGFSK
jgi:hypothetical protein